MTDTKDLTDKQKLFEKKFERSGQYLSDEADKEICNILDSVQITEKKQEIVDLLEDLTYDKMLYDELEECLYGEESYYNIENLKDDDVVKNVKLYTALHTQLRVQQYLSYLVELYL